jgi:hypothetical protein
MSDDARYGWFIKNARGRDRRDHWHNDTEVSFLRL